MRRIAPVTLMVISVCLLIFAYARNPAVTKANYDRIEVGTTVREAEKILGCRKVAIPNERIGLLPEFSQYEWDEDGDFCVITFDKHGRVVDKRWVDRRPTRETWLDVVCGWI